VTFAAALAAARARGDDPASLADLAELALAEGQEPAALAVIAPAADGCGDARLWQWTGLLHRAVDDHAEALEAFAAAARLAPNDASIAHGQARVTLEAGLDARQLFDRALRLGPSGDVILGRAAARFAMGEGDAAAAELAAILDHNPLWVQGHVQWAQLASMIGRRSEAMTTIDRALAGHRTEPSLWHAAIQTLVRADRHAEAWGRADAAIAATGDTAGFALARATALSDVGELERAEAAFKELGEPQNVSHAISLARHLIRGRSWTALSALADRWMAGDSAHLFWPYASVAWRQSGDSRWQWLEGDERLVQTFDLGPELPSLDALANGLRRLHARSGRFLDQSVRGGTQTDGPLLSRLDPEIRALRVAIVEAVEDYRSSLPADPGHPMLRHARGGPARFAGSWSVLLEGAGYHSRHVHPQGWISSAFYVAVPAGLTDQEGWLTLGEPPPDLGIQLPPIRRIQPKPGQLVLFPSMMWHGTLPFAAGERMTVAFDIAPPR
jgi:tetratricopeptide (TPR) repeat protein